MEPFVVVMTQTMGAEWLGFMPALMDLLTTTGQ